MFNLFKSHRHAALRKEPLTPTERAILEQNVPYLAKLLAEKSFEGCGGLELTHELAGFYKQDPAGVARTQPPSY